MKTEFQCEKKLSGLHVKSSTLVGTKTTVLYLARKKMSSGIWPDSKTCWGNWVVENLSLKFNDGCRPCNWLQYLPSHMDLIGPNNCRSRPGSSLRPSLVLQRWNCWSLLLCQGKNLHFQENSWRFPKISLSWFHTIVSSLEKFLDLTPSQFQYWASLNPSLILLLIQNFDHVTFHTWQSKSKSGLRLGESNPSLI